MNNDPFSTPAVRRILGVAAACVLLGLSACASRPDVEWTSPELGADSSLLRGANVLVACEAPDVAIRNACQDQLAGALAKRGAHPVVVDPNTPLTTNRALDEQLVPSARSASSKAIIVMAIRPAGTEAEGSGFSLGIGGFGFGRGSAVGGAISAPLGDSRVETAYAANGRVTDVASGHLVWTASATGTATSDIRQQLSALADELLNSAQRAGLF